MNQRLPARFPVGTKFVIEARQRSGEPVYRRHIEFPDGTVFRLPQPKAEIAGERRLRARRRDRR